MSRLSTSNNAKAILLVGLGGLVGANLRYGVGAVAGEALVTTLLVNAIGSFGLGLLLFDARADAWLSRRIRYLLGTGFFASFTTYSTFVADIMAASIAIALVYIIGSYLGGFLAVLLSRQVISARTRATVPLPYEGEG